MKNLMALLLLLPVLASAADMPDTGDLLSQPASMMDIGLVRANAEFRKFESTAESGLQIALKNKEIGIVATEASYDASEDLIVFFVWISGVKNVDPRVACSAALKDLSSVVKSNLEWWFFPSQDWRLASQEKRGVVIAKRVELRCAASSVRARQRLLEDSIYWTEK